MPIFLLYDILVIRISHAKGLIIKSYNNALSACTRLKMFGIHCMYFAGGFSSFRVPSVPKRRPGLDEFNDPHLVDRDEAILKNEVNK